MTRRPWVWALQALLLLAVAVLVWRSLHAHWDQFRTLDVRLTLHLGWIALAAAAVLPTYGLLIAAWRGIITGWDQRLPYLPAVRIWTLSNLGRYLPGKVWSVAGLAVLAQRRGVAPWAAVGSAIVMQAVAVGSGVIVALATVPGAASPLAFGAALVVAATLVLTFTMPGAAQLVARIIPGADLRPLSPGAVLRATGATAVAWVGYGAAFWCLARGILGPTTLSLATASGVFAAGYLVGLLAIVAPGGVGVREAVFLAFLTPALGSGPALALTVASRLLLTLTEALAAVAGLALRERRDAATSS
ncbi:MAG: lysylphosphatidylglycerol synthase domain-containing protein [Gemmatimonadota bacterium]|nr:lysylphosphatidylglycerol synthase domain-containing protein [Gemmatimonadota bacterium]